VQKKTFFLPIIGSNKFNHVGGRQITASKRFQTTSNGTERKGISVTSFELE